MPVKDRFYVKKHFEDVWQIFEETAIVSYGYTLAINLAIKNYIDKTTDVKGILKYAEINPDFKRRLKEGLEGI